MTRLQMKLNCDLIGCSMSKEFIKSRIRKTGTYRVVEIELEKSKNQIQILLNDKEKLIQQKNQLQKDKQKLNQQRNQLQKDKQKLIQQKKIIQNRILNSKMVLQNLKNENKSIKEILIDENYFKKDADFSKFTIIIPYREVGDQDRVDSLDINLNYLGNMGIENVIISEYSDSSSENFLNDNYHDLFKNFMVIWNDAGGELFNKSLAINKGVMASKTPYIAIFDMDCLTKKENIYMALNLLDKGFDVVHPFDRKVKDIVDKQAFIERYDFKTLKTEVQDRIRADGGIVFWNKVSFIKIGMKNEYFIGWGGEDNEIMYRANLFNLKHFRINDILYHLYHERPQNRSDRNFKLEVKSASLKSKDECLEEINKWPWVFEAKKLVE